MPRDAVSSRVDLVYGIVLLLVAVPLFVSTYSEKYAFDHLFGDVSTVFVPRLFLGLWILLALLLCLRCFGKKASVERKRVSWELVAIVGVISFATGTAMMWLGFLISSIPGVALLAWVFGARRPSVLAAVGIVGPVAVWAALTFGASLSLPHSPWSTMM